MSITTIAVKSAIAGVLAYGAIAGSSAAHADSTDSGHAGIAPAHCHTVVHCHIKRLEHGRI